MNTIKEGTKKVIVKRAFEGIQAYKSSQSMSVIYKEFTYIEEEVTNKEGVKEFKEVLLKEETKPYPRDYAYWEASELGQAIIGMINLDLMQEDPSAPRVEE